MEASAARDAVRSVLSAAAGRSAQDRAALDDLIRIPSVSAPGFDPVQVRRSAEATVALLESAGLEAVRIVELDGCPNVIGEWSHAGPDAPTVLLYAHHDVQPPGIVDDWTSDPWEPVERDGRLYGRGSADDKAGAVAHAAVVRAWLDAAGELPVNVKVLVEGEEEIGSPNLATFLGTYADDLAADVLVLADAGNFSVGTPGLTYALRGMGSMVVRVRSAASPLHSGMAGGAAPDAAMALVRMLASLVDDHGDLAVPGADADVRALTDAERARLDAIPTDGLAASLAAAWFLDDGVELCGDPALPIFERLWFRPSLAILGLDTHPIAGSSNQILGSAAARLGVRFAPGQDPDRVMRRVAEHLRAQAPFGMGVTFEFEEAAPAWVCEPSGAAFDAAIAALRDGFGADPVLMGVGGSIPFVEPFAATFGGIPALLLGPADPGSRIHGTDESLHLGDFAKLIAAEIHLLANLTGSVATREISPRA